MEGRELLNSCNGAEKDRVIPDEVEEEEERAEGPNRFEEGGVGDTTLGLEEFDGEEMVLEL